MTARSRRYRALAFISILSICVGTFAIAADPKVKRAAHEQPAKPKRLETVDVDQPVTRLDAKPTTKLDDQPAEKPEAQPAIKLDAQPTNPAESQLENPSDVVNFSPNWPEPPNTSAIFMRLGIGTFVVLALCVGSLWLGKPWLKRLQVVSNGNPTFFVEGTVSVGNRATLFLVRAGDTQLVAGIDATGLKSLVALPMTFKEVLDEQVPETEPATPTTAVRPATLAATTPIPTTPAPFDMRSLQRPFSRGTQ